MDMGTTIDTTTVTATTIGPIIGIATEGINRRTKTAQRSKQSLMSAVHSPRSFRSAGHLELKDIDDWSRSCADRAVPSTSAEIPQLTQESELDQRSSGLAPRVTAALAVERANPEAAVCLTVRLPRSTQHGGRLTKEIGSSSFY